MWQPNRAQWSIIWTVAVLVILVWPPDTGKSLAAKGVNWAVDPGGALPSLPQPLPMALDDDGDAVAAHDMLEADYYLVRKSSALTRWRMDLKEAGDPFDRQTVRQLLVGLAVAGALLTWRLQSASSSPKK